METLYYASVALVMVIALGDWRSGLYLAVVLDALRDPIRKLTESQSVAITIAGACVWVVVAFGAFRTERHASNTMVRMYPKLKQVPPVLILAMLPGAVLSVLLYTSGRKLALIGGTSYMLPLVGVALGFLIVNSARSVERFLKVYIIINSMMLVGVPLEYMGLTFPGLGGIEMDWIRYHKDYTVKLIAGFYRSPDIMGLHAANLVVFALILAERTRGERRLGWLAFAFWGGYCVLLAGRRKMMGIPLVFLAGVLFIGHLRGARKARKWMLAAGLCAFVGFSIFLVTAEDESSDAHLAYAATTFTEGPQRANTLIVGGSIGTIIQSGALGAGLGTCTQGGRYADVQRAFASRGWQEDGVSRLFLEFGIPGIVVLLMAGMIVTRAALRALRFVPANSPIQLFQIAILSAFLGNAASFVISHQHFSGDPGGAIIAMLLFGVFFGIPRLLHTAPRQQDPIPDITNRRLPRPAFEEFEQGQQGTPVQSRGHR